MIDKNNTIILVDKYNNKPKPYPAIVEVFEIEKKAKIFCLSKKFLVGGTVVNLSIVIQIQYFLLCRIKSEIKLNVNLALISNLGSRQTIPIQYQYFGDTSLSE